ncbi:MAG: glycosyltransferase [Candidatus Dadabacteria bacterium]|nr:glycosyltransferase [Candidatus Dadabacteria bacterium]
MIQIGIVIPARNEQRYLRNTLERLKIQTMQPEQVIIIDDNSIGGVPNLAEDFGVEIYKFPQQHENWVTDYKLASVFNLGFRFLKDNLDYVMVLGADHLLPNNYIEQVVTRMENRPKLVVASGKIDNEWIVTPRGSGRLIKTSFFKKIGSVYPINWGFESYILYKALQLGYEIDVFADIHSQTQRETKTNYKQKHFYNYGKAMQALGYPHLYAIGRCLVMSKRKGAANGFAMYKGFLSNHVQPYEQELREHVKNTHKFSLKHIDRFFEYGFGKAK